MGTDLCVRDLMGRDVTTLRRNDKLTIADELMRMERIRHLPVVDDEEELVTIMIELVAQELHEDLEAYKDFCPFRISEEQHRGTDEDLPTREEWLKAKRQQLHAPIRGRRDRRRASQASESGGSPFGLW